MSECNHEYLSDFKGPVEKCGDCNKYCLFCRSCMRNWILIENTKRIVVRCNDCIERLGKKSSKKRPKSCPPQAPKIKKRKICLLA